jgi:transposase
VCSVFDEPAVRKRRQEEGVYSVHDWAELKHLCQREGLSKKAAAEKLGMSRTTAHRLLSLSEPPVYERTKVSSLLDPHREAILAMLREDPTVRATVIRERLQADGYAGGITIVKDFVADVRPQFLAARAYQRTSYLPGEIGQVDWWHLPVRVPLREGVRATAHALVVTLPHSAAHAAFFTHRKTLHDFLPALLGCLTRLGGAPSRLVLDNDTSMVVRVPGHRSRLHAEAAAVFGELRAKSVILPPRRPTSKGQVERTVGYLETSFLPLRSFRSLEDLQTQHDSWAKDVAYRRSPRRLGARVADAYLVEKTHLSPLPDPLPDTDQQIETRVSKDAFVRACGADYSVPPGLVGRRVQLRVSLSSVFVYLEGREIARHLRSYVPADVVVDPDHARALVESREARTRLRGGDVAVEVPDLARYDALLRVTL